MGEALTAIRRRCPAPRPIGPLACGRNLEMQATGAHPPVP
jgi:hypothetical protein